MPCHESARGKRDRERRTSEGKEGEEGGRAVGLEGERASHSGPTTCSAGPPLLHVLEVDDLSQAGSQWEAKEHRYCRAGRD